MRAFAIFLLIPHFTAATEDGHSYHGHRDLYGAEKIHNVMRILDNHSEIWKESLSISHSQSIVLEWKGIVEFIATQKKESLSLECSQDFEILWQGVVDSVKNLSLTPFTANALLPMLDSSGRIGPAVLKGHIYFLGHLQECMAIDVPVFGRERNFKGGYFRFYLDVASRPNTAYDACSPSGGAPYLEYAICLPLSCTSRELQLAFKPEDGSMPFINNSVCKVKKLNDDVEPKDAGFYIVASFMGLVTGIAIIAGLVDYFMKDHLGEAAFTKCKQALSEWNEQLFAALSWKLFISFSLYSNVCSIFNVEELNKEGQIAPLHCIRAISMIWVVLGHFASIFTVLVANPLDVFALAHEVTTEVMLNAYYAVDTFFFLSGLLLSFIWFKNYNRSPRATNSPLAWIMFYVHRILRLSPPYYIMTLFFTFVFKQLLIDTPINMTSLYTEDFCKKNWWLDLLYIHNFVGHTEACTGYSWYLDTEMQIFIFTPIILLPLAMKPVIGFIIAFFLLVVSTGINIFLVYFYHWPTNGAWLYTPDPLERNYSDYAMLMYDAPYIRCQTYIIGMLVGWLLQNKRRMRINKLLNIVLWVMSLSVMLCAVLGLHDQTNGVYMTVFWRAMYSALSRIGFGIGLSWIIISCYYGYGGPFNDFMSWYIWAPLGRITYCTYLIHVPTMMILLAQSTDGFIFTTFFDMFVFRFLPIVIMSFFVAIFWSSLFELPFGKVEMLLIGDLRRKENNDYAENGMGDRKQVYDITAKNEDVEKNNEAWG